MNRTVVLVLCLTSAAGIAVYTQYSHGETGEPVYTVPPRSAEPPSRPAAAVRAKPIDPTDRAALARELQRELKRVGCYNGEITGVWTTSSRMAMKSFVERVNATLPIDSPDPVLLSLVQGHQQRACGIPCPAGQTAADDGACLPNGVVAKAATKAPAEAGPDAKQDTRPDTRPEASLSAATLAPIAPAAAARPDPRTPVPPMPETRRPAPVARQSAPPPDVPVPPEGIRERRPRRTAETAPPRPPKVVRDVLKVFGLKY